MVYRGSSRSLHGKSSGSESWIEELYEDEVDEEDGYIGGEENQE